MSWKVRREQVLGVVAHDLGKGAVDAQEAAVQRTSAMPIGASSKAFVKRSSASSSARSTVGLTTVSEHVPR